MSWQTILTDATVTVAIIGLIGLLIKALIDFHASRPNAEKINVETFEKVTGQLDRLEAKVIDLRADNDKLQDRVEKLEQKNNELKAWVRGLLRQLDAANVQYTPPPPGLLDTDPNIPKVGK